LKSINTQIGKKKERQKRT